MLSTTPHWHRPDRKLSTPFFPGAWPNNSTHSALLSTADAKDAEDIEAQLQSAGPGSKGDHSPSSSSVTEHIYEERVMAFHERVIRTLSEGQTEHPDQHALPVTALSSILSESSQTTMLTSATTLSNVSEAIATPDTLSPSNSMLSPVSHRKSRTFRKRFSFQRLLSHDKKTKSQDRDLNARHDVDAPVASSMSDNTRSLGASTASLAAPVPGLPPLPFPSHTLTFTPESVASFFSVSDQSSRLNMATSSGTPTSPSTFSPAELATSVYGSPDADTAHSAVINTSLEDPELGQPARGTHETSTLSFTSSRPDADSPVLPSDEDAGSGILPSQRSKHLLLTHVLAPSSADMDAFGLAAACEYDIRSTSSIPTSFRSAFAAETISRSQSLSMDDTARGRARRQSSVSLSLSLNLSEDSIDPPPNEGDLRMAQNTGNYTFERVNVYDSTSITYPPMKTRSDPPLTTVVTTIPPHESGTNRFMSLDKVKKFGGRIKQLFRGKAAGETVEGGVGVTTTAVTTVEYPSEHPITLPKDKGKRRVLEKAQPNPRSNTRRQSMPISSTGPAVAVSSPRPLRPNSFLLLDDPSEKLTARKLSLTSSASGKRQLREGYASGSDTKPSNSKERLDGGLSLPPTFVPPTTPPSRFRTQTAPDKPAHGGAAKPRRFSLSSGISRSRLDLLKTTIIPHPPLPQHVVHSMRDDVKARTRAMSMGTEGDSFDNTPPPNDDGMVNETQQDHRLGTHDDRTRSVSPIRYLEVNEGAHTISAQGETDIGWKGDGPEETDVRMFAKDEKTPQTPRRTSKAVVTGVRRTPQTPSESPLQGKGRRARGFSLSSAISSRAMKAKSLILGRAPPQESGAHLSPPFLGAPGRGNENIFSPTSSVGCADYEPNLALDNISFAHMSAFTSSVVSTDEMSPRELSPSEARAHATWMDGVFVEAGGAGDEGDEIQHGREEQEKSLVRALGLPYGAQEQTTSDSA